MFMDKGKAIGIVVLSVVCCAVMALVETVVEPAYFVKSAIKAAVFLIIPLIFMKISGIKAFGGLSLPNKKAVFGLLLLGAGVYAAVMGAYLLTKARVDYSVLVASLTADQKVEGFLPMALYISFGNSFLEEFLFRNFAFIKLSEHISKKLAYAFSSIAFAVYHIAMIGAAFPPPLTLLCVLGLALGGLLFDYVDDRSKSIYRSWVIHMFADIAIMTIWYINI